MQVKHHKTTILIAAATLLLAVVGCHNDGSALTYQDAIGVRFTFNPTVSINVSGDLTISDLAPGSASDSNIVTITSGTNSPTGYSLYGTVGSTANNYTDLKSNSSDKTKFTNLTETKTTLANFSDNTWGYSYCVTTNDCDTDNTKWVSGSAGSVTTGYNGLPIYDASDSAAGVLLASSDSATDTELKFKIGAKASLNQASGTYTNVINFIGVANPVPISIGDLIYLQDFAALTSSDKTVVIDSMIPETTYTLQDKRDLQPYTIAKLKDGKVWMTKNLNLAGGTEITSTLSDVPDDYILPVTLGFQTGNKLPESSSRTFNGNARVYNSGNTACGEETPCYSYYSWEPLLPGLAME